jgi:hypothetical protein
MTTPALAAPASDRPVGDLPTDNPVTGRAAPEQRSPRLPTVRPAPRREPPFDDEVPHLHRVGALDRPLPFARPLHPVPMPLRQPRRSELPDPALWGRRLLVGITETAAGKRPLQQLAALVSPSVAHGLGAEFERAAATGRRHWLATATLRSVRAAEPAEGAAELSATLLAGSRVRAVAMRLDAREGRWRCTRLQLG